MGRESLLPADMKSGLRRCGPLAWSAWAEVKARTGIRILGEASRTQNHEVRLGELSSTPSGVHLFHTPFLSINKWKLNLFKQKHALGPFCFPTQGGKKTEE